MAAERSYVLVPGAGGEAWYWHRVVAELAARGREGLAVDLPAAEESAGLVEYAQAVVDAVGDRRHVIMVGQSMGAYAVSISSERLSVDLLVLVNPMIPAPEETPGEWWSNTGQGLARVEQAARDGRSTEGGFDPIEGFFHDVPADVTAQAMARGEPRQADRPFGDAWSLQAWPRVPTKVLQGRDDRLFPVEFQRRVARERLGIEIDEMPGGHLVALSRPVELVDRLEAYAAAL